MSSDFFTSSLNVDYGTETRMCARSEIKLFGVKIPFKVESVGGMCMTDIHRMIVEKS